jgi:site-specific DNA-methyltransferase (adenine-specific)
MQMIGYMPPSQTDDWATPSNLFAELDEIYHFTFDAAASSKNHLCKKWAGLDHENAAYSDGLTVSWANEIVWCNPPYGRQIKDWMKKAHNESTNAKIVMLLPARTDTMWFHEYAIIHKVTFLRGRLKFGGQKVSAPFPSILVEMGK